MSLAFDTGLDRYATAPARARRIEAGWPWRALGLGATRDVVADAKRPVASTAPSFWIVVHRHMAPESSADVAGEGLPVYDTVVDFSMETLRRVREGARSSTLSARASAVSEAHAEAVSDEMLSRFLDEQFRYLLASVADVYAAYGVGTRAISDLGGFTDEFDASLQARIPVRPKSFEAFSNCLHVDVTRSLRRNGVMERPWGRLEATPAGLVMHVDERPPLVIDFGERAEILE